MKDSNTKLPTDTWVDATWEDYTQALANPTYAMARGYYHDGQLRIDPKILVCK